jgi:hypothetical protein
MKILVLDIETAPNLAHVWGLWQQNVGLPQIIEPGYVLCWAAKWYGEDEMTFRSIEKHGQIKMLQDIWQMIDDADAIIHYNGQKFDMPTLNREFILAGMQPPSTYKHIDLLKTCRKQFNFPSNKLEYVARALKIGKKVKHYGHELWIRCMNHEDEAWDTMEKYNKMDVQLTEELYDRLLPWIPGHPNHNLYRDDLADEACCTNCGSTKLQPKGYQYLVTGKYRRYNCKDCGTHVRGNKRENNGETMVVPAT